MQEKMKEIYESARDYWRQLTNKQRTIIISAVAVAIVALGILVWSMNKKDMMIIADQLTTSQTSEIKKLFDEAGIGYEINSAGTSISIDSKKESDARLLLGSQGFEAKSGYDYEWAFNNGFATTEKEKREKYKIAQQSMYARDLANVEDVESATVEIKLPDDSYNIFTEKEEASVAAMLVTKRDLPESTIQVAAKYLANALGIKDMSNVVITDQSKVLYMGEESSDGSGVSVGTQLDNTNKNIVQMKKSVTEAILSTKVWTEVTVMPQLTLDYDETHIQDTQYTPDANKTEGLLGSSYDYETTQEDGASGIAGTDTNGGDTTYNMPDGTGGSGNTVISQNTYLPNKKVIDQVKAKGSIKKDESSVALVLTRQITTSKKELQDSGALEGTTYEAYKAANSNKVAVTVEPQMYDLISKATGLDTPNISILAYEYTVFEEPVKVARPWTNYLPIILTVLIVGLLGFVIYKGTAPVEETEIEPELSVETLIATTKENQTLDDIEFNGKSEARKQIEKFVDENPEAVASLLRNWLNEDWD